ncbi:hypothetical protein M3J09_007689 [Ascochyta lentis]
MQLPICQQQQTYENTHPHSRKTQNKKRTITTATALSTHLSKIHTHTHTHTRTPFSPAVPQSRPSHPPTSAAQPTSLHEPMLLVPSLQSKRQSGRGCCNESP